MQIEQTENELIIRETPGCLWIFAIFFAFVGGLFVYGALGGLTDFDRHELWMLALIFAAGVTGLGAGFWMIYRAPVTKVVIDRTEDEILITRYGLFGRRQTFYAFDDVEQFFLIEEKDSEGDPVWSLGMKLITDETIKISSLPSHDERFKRSFVLQSNEFLEKNPPSAPMNLEAQDETDAKIS